MKNGIFQIIEFLRSVYLTLMGVVKRLSARIVLHELTILEQGMQYDAIMVKCESMQYDAIMVKCESITGHLDSRDKSTIKSAFQRATRDAK